MIHVGLTGGIASGKTTVCRLLEAKGCTIIDADVVAHHLLLRGERAMSLWSKPSDEVFWEMQARLIAANSEPWCLGIQSCCKGSTSWCTRK